MAGSGNQRDLLLAHLALELNFINADTLEAAKKVWTADKSRPMGQILVERQAISPHTRDVLENLVQLQVVQDASEEDQTPMADMDATDRGDIALLSPPKPGAPAAPAGEDGDDVAMPVLGAPPLRFRKMRPHAAGALGQVYIARDKELRRKVALKEIKELYADNPEARSRFLLEAEITGRLEHPGVVPVYGMGTYANGRPFYAMRFIKGESMDEAIKHLYQPDATRTPGDRALELRKLLTRFVGVCNTMQYAHDRDIVHRDIKPSNIMLGTYGETLVVDWGLAKVMGRLIGDAGSSILEPLPSSGSSTDTLPGRAVGTITYMSPEQAAGRVDALSAVSDVYSLGATLFTVLTGRASVEDSSAADQKRIDIRKLQAKVVSGDVHRPRQINSTVDRPLDAICAKAMALRPEDRYRSARALADDVERWLANEPVSAWPEPVTVRAARWISKHRTTVSVGGVAIILGLAFFVTQTLILTVDNDLLAKETERAKKAETTAKDAEQKAVDANAQLVVQKNAADAAKTLAQIQKKEADEQRLIAVKARDAATTAENLEKAARIETEKGSALHTTMLAQARWNEGQVLLANEMLEQVDKDLREGGWYYLRRQFEGSYATLYGHTEGVRAVASSNDGQLVASAGAEGKLIVWDARTGRPVATIDAGSAFAFSPGSDQLATGGADGTIKLWNPRKGVLLSTSDKLHDDAITSVAYSPDGKRLASGDQDGKIKLCDAATLKDVVSVKTKKGATGVTALTFSPDGKRLASTGLDRNLFIWDPATGEFTQAFPRATNGIAGVSYSPDGKFFASAGMDESVHVWKADNSDEVLTFKTHHGKGVTRLAYSPDGQRIATAGWDGLIKLWDAGNGREKSTLQGHAAAVMSIAFSPDDQRLVSGSADCTVKLWEPRTGQELENFSEQLKAIACIAFDPVDSNRLASGGWNGTLKVWNTATGAVAWEAPKAHASEILAVAFSPDGKRVASAGQDGKVKLWDAATGKEVGVTFKGHADAVTSLAFNADGTRLASAGKDKTVVIWNTADGKAVRTLPNPDASAEITGVSLSPDGTHLAWADKVGSVKVWNIDPKGDLSLTPITAHSVGITSVVFSPDGKLIATAGQDGRIHVWMWNGERADRFLSLKGHAGGVMGVSFSRDGKRLASASKDGTVKLWDVRTGQDLKTFKGHDDLVTSVAFSPDGMRVASASLDKTIRLWSAASAKESRMYKDKNAKAVVGVAFSKDGKEMFSRDEAGKIVTFDADTGKAIDKPKGQPAPTTRAAVSPDGKKLALPFANWFYVVDLDVSKADADYRTNMSRVKPWWHANRAEAYEKEKHWYAAAFHWAWASSAEPTVQRYRDRFDETSKQLSPAEVQTLRRQAGLK